jgi:hypothetical protein
MEVLDGITLIELRTVEVTVPVALPLIVPTVAVTLPEPVVTPVARPVALTVRTASALELHVAWAVTSCVVPSLYTPRADNCLAWPAAMEKEDGRIVMEDSVGVLPVGGTEGALITTDVVPATVPNVAVIVTVPALIAVSSPALLIVAIVLSELCQVT